MECKQFVNVNKCVGKTGIICILLQKYLWFNWNVHPLYCLPVDEIKTGYFKCYRTLFGKAKLKQEKVVDKCNREKASMNITLYL